jgi:type I restriction enzyme S subunit
MNNDWKTSKLSSLARLRIEKTEPFPGDDRRYVGLEHIVSGQPKLIENGTADGLTSQKSVFKPGDVLYGKLRPALRKVIRIDFEGICSTDILPITPIDPEDGSYLHQILRGDAVLAWALGGAEGTKMPRTSWQRLREFAFPCPPRKERRKIAAVLDSIDEAIERTEAVIEATEQLRKALLQELLTRGVPGWHTEWKPVKGIGTIPADWEVVRLGDIYEVQLGKMLSPKAKTGQSPRPYLTNRNVRWGAFDLSDVPEMDFDEGEFEKFSLCNGDLLVCEGGEVGRAAIWREEISGCCYQKALHRLRPLRDSASPEYLLYFLIFASERGFLLEHSERTSIAHLTRERLMRMKIAHPPIEEQLEIVSAISSIEMKMHLEESYLHNINTVKCAVADALLSGRVRVPVPRNDGGKT